MNPARSSRLVMLSFLGLLYFLLMASTFNSLGQVLPSMVRDLGLSWAEAGFGFTLLGVACGIASLAPAVLIRVAGVAWTLLAGTALLVGGFLCLARSEGVLAYQGGTILLGVGFCFCGTVPAVHLISASFVRRSAALGFYFTIGGLGAVAGPLFFLLVSEGSGSGGWRGYWLICAAAAAVVGALAALSTRLVKGAGAGAAERGERAGEGGWTLRAALAAPQLWVTIAAYTGCLLVNTTMHSFAFQHLMEHGQSKESATALISLAALIAAGGSALAGAMGERVDGRRLTLLSLAMLALAAASLAVARGWPALALFAVSMGVGLGVSYVGTAMLLQDYFGPLAALELYSLMTVVSTSAALGPGLGGIVRDRTHSFSGVFAGIAAIDALLFVLVLMMRRPRPPAAAATPA